MIFTVSVQIIIQANIGVTSSAQSPNENVAVCDLVNVSCLLSAVKLIYNTVVSDDNLI